MPPAKNLRTTILANGDLKLSIPCFAQTKGERVKGLKDVPHDVKLQVGPDKQVVDAHKEVLKESIPYFSAMFSGNFQESTQQVIDLPDIDSVEAVKKLVDFVYKGTVVVNGQDVQEVFQVCDVWGLDNVKAKCADFMIRELDCHNCFDLLCLGELYSMQEMTDACKELIAREFQIISKMDSFVDLPGHIVTSLVKRDDLNLGPQREDCMMEAVIRWIRHDLPERLEYVEKFRRHLKYSWSSQSLREDFISLKPEAVKEEVEMRMKRYGPDPNCFGMRMEIEPYRRHKDNIMVFCGYSHTRSGYEEFKNAEKARLKAYREKLKREGDAAKKDDRLVKQRERQRRYRPTSPRMKTVEKFNLQSLKSETIELPEAPSYGAAFNLLGRIVYFAVVVRTDSMTNKHTVHTQVYTFKPEQPSAKNKYRVTPEVFSERATDCIKSCLVSKGCVVHCPVKNLIYAVSIQDVVCLKVSCTNGEIFCDYDKPLANLKAILTEENHSGMKSVCLKGKLYVIGGNSGPEMEPSFSRNTYVLSEDGTSWKELHFMNYHRTEFAVASYRGELIVSGGYGGKTSLRRLQTCEVYGTDVDCWAPFFSLRQSKSHHCMVVANGTLYAIAGKTYSSQKLSDSGGWLPGGARIVSSLIEKLDTSDGMDIWQRFGRLNQGRCMFCAVAV